MLSRAMENDRKLRQRVLEVIHKITMTITEFDLQLPSLLQVLPEPNVRLDNSALVCGVVAPQLPIACGN
jgi:hypothetical protein